MKPPERIKRKLLAEWLRKADADLEVAKHLFNEGAIYPNAIAFHSQQAAEKYLKAFLTWHQVAFPKTHDLEALLDLVEFENTSLAESLRDIIILTSYGIELRYPGDIPDTTDKEARKAVELADKVYRAVMASLADIL